MAGLYFGLLIIPPLLKYHTTLTLVFRVYSIVSLVYVGLRIQGKTIEWAVSRIGQGTAREKMLNSLVPMTRQIGSLLILAMGGLIILDQLGISIAPLTSRSWNRWLSSRTSTPRNSNKFLCWTERHD